MEKERLFKRESVVHPRHGDAKLGARLIEEFERVEPDFVGLLD